jgi:hypothetical protein
MGERGKSSPKSLVWSVYVNECGAVEWLLG